jgi:hypothetical protein
VPIVTILKNCRTEKGSSLGQTDEIAESPCSAESAKLCRHRTFDKVLLFHAGDMQTDGPRRDESISQQQ